MCWAIKKRNLAVFNLVDFVIRQITKINSMSNFHLIWYYSSQCGQLLWTHMVHSSAAMI